MRGKRTLLMTSAVALIGAAVGPAGAADTTLGEVFVATTCSPATFLQPASPGGQYTAPAAGVITSWSTLMTGTPGQVSFKVARAGAAANQVLITASSPLVNATGGRTVTQKSRIAVQAGDYIGIAMTGSAACVSDGVPTSYRWQVVGGNAQPGTVAVGGSGTGSQYTVSAVFEPDADKDGFGDVSQDLCPTDATTQGTCPAPVAPVVDRTAPETTITSVVAKKAKSAGKKASVTATFAASETSTFECAVDSPVFVPCSSPYGTQLKAGKHTLAVRATDAAGNVDRSAAVTSIKVKVGKPKK